ncbi:DUF2057 family protein [Pseudoalteromonas sp. SR44-5]|uniref:DUF2057 family protein n=1 Tax=Pseudoalteromonas TaxID=53246 RepID=UPI00123066A9|nr:MULTISPECIES: DUF2057 family protein [Pseudoalteromonas]MBB1335880.1 DUF2057 family protein [Pseudoalteromonas sp. SR41-6]MBB1344210.1 DUF2057 family protein [Pseudoalteromonas sp. SR45-6]MBB1368501.1 DUF2057 family protein [Pseudoalteromonas sp. SR44-5]MBB1423924.1 DUF2057 family protein [Pseudoalteromonas sp. SG43-7]MBB1436178.1 DUF2057 family protein [Pseudoalteromonas sp. SG43-6]
MRKQILLSGIVSLFLSATSVAETVNFPEEIVPLQVGDKKIEHSFFNRVDEIELVPGVYQVKLKYTDLYEQGYDEHQVIDSEPFWVTMTIAANTDYDVVFNRADNAVAAEVFAEAPQVSLQAKGASLGTPLAIIAEPDLTSSASSQVATVQVAPTAASTTRAAPNAANLQAPVSRPAPNAGNAPSAAAMLDFWWQQASAQEQQAFIDKVTKNK